MRIIRLLFAAMLVVPLGACRSLHEPRCSDVERAAIHDALFFGAATPDGAVSAEEWAEFLGATVTPRFPQGLTVSPAAGQWRGEDGAIVREDSRLLQLVHPDDAASEASIREIVATYKSRFRQEAVLRVRTATCVSF